MPKAIDKCKGENCPMELKKKCRRYREPENSWQSWIRGKVNVRLQACPDFMVIR